MKSWYPWIGVGVFAVWHGFCHFYNLYFLVWWTDIVAHFIGGVTGGAFFWLFLEKRKISKDWINAVSVIAFSTMISVFWEYWEFSNWRYSFLRDTVGRIQQQYYPYWGNNLGDIFWGMVGGIVIGLAYLLIAKSNKK